MNQYKIIYTEKNGVKCFTKIVSAVDKKAAHRKVNNKFNTIIRILEANPRSFHGIEY